MKIAVTCQGEDVAESIDPRFGRAKTFAIYDTDSREICFISNEQNMQAAQGAGIQAARTIIDSGAKILITGNVGPKAFTALKSGGIEMYTGASGTVEQAINDYHSGKLKKAEAANVEGHW
jgi:predicted Fe-Mo cluster-binding NifX family protein